MPTKKAKPAEVPPDLPPEKAYAALSAQLKRLQDLKGRNYCESDAAENEWFQLTEKLIIRSFGSASTNYRNFRLARSAGEYFMIPNGGHIDEGQNQRNFQVRLQEYEAALKSCLSELELDLPGKELHEQQIATAAQDRKFARLAIEEAHGSVLSPDRRTVFVIHGRDERLRIGMFDFLRSLDLKPLEWSEAVKLTGKASPYIGEILDAAFSRAQAVVVLFSPDDEARLRRNLQGPSEPVFETQLTPQARPNVLFESGMAMARDPDRTVLVEMGELRPFSDIGGRHTIRMDNSVQKRQILANRLHSAGCDVNLSGTDWQTRGELTPPPNDHSDYTSRVNSVGARRSESVHEESKLAKFKRVIIAPVSRSTSQNEYTLETVDETGVLIRLPGGTPVRIPKADYYESWDDASQKPKLVLTRKYFQGYFPGHEHAEEYFLPR